MVEDQQEIKQKEEETPPEVDIKEAIADFNNFRDKVQRFLLPVQKPLMYLAIIFLLIMFMFIGYGAGGYHVCYKMEGFLDDSFSCVLDNYPDGSPKNPRTPTVIIPSIGGLDYGI